MIVATLIVLGLVFGSFVNALVWRLRKQDELAYPELKDGEEAVVSTGAGGAAERSPEKRKMISQQAQKDNGENYSIMHGRSMCPDCHHTLAAKDLVPVLSWLALGGKCRYCRKPISWQYPLVELLTAVLFAASYLLWPLELDTYGITRLVVWLVYAVFFMALSVYDFRWQELPDRLVWPLVGIAVSEAVLVAFWQQNMQSFLLAALAGCLLFGLFWIIYQVSKGEWIGGGDVKIVLALGIIVGTPLQAFLIIFIASVIGTIASLPLLLGNKRARGAQIPFGPALMLATCIVYFASTSIIAWYQALLT